MELSAYVRLFVTIRTNQGLSIQQNNLTPATVIGREVGGAMLGIKGTTS